MGAGAIGSYLGASLSHDGHDVTLVEPWAEHVEAIRTDGLRAEGPHDPFTARPAAVNLNEASSLPADFDIAFVAVKARDTVWATHFITRFIDPDGYVVAAQNCWTDPTVASIAGAENAVGLIMSRISVSLEGPGFVRRGAGSGKTTGHVVFRAGEHDGRITPRTESLAAMMSCIDGAVATDNLWGERWSKLSQNSMGNPVSAMSGLGSSETAAMQRARMLSIRLASESAQVGLALGYDIPGFGGVEATTWADATRGDVFEELDAMLAKGAGSGGSWRASMAQDVGKGRRSEVDYMNGHVVAMGREAGVPTPVSAAVVAVMHEIDDGVREPSPANIERALSMASL